VDRETGLRALRQSNFKILIQKLKHFQPKGSRLLDVGSAHGWFLDSANEYFDALGIEPDKAIFETSSAQGKTVRFGYFPEVLLTNERFDVIVFNDVIEHIQDIGSILKSCYKHLNMGGLLLLNLPSSRGIFYWTAKLLCRFGIYTPFERLWQKDMPSPHIHYFHKYNLYQLVSQNFIEMESGTLASFCFNGLFTRISYVKANNRIIRCALYCIIMMLYPFLKILPKDIMYSIYKRKD
jgi:SAM-dependent methyltransferase